MAKVKGRISHFQFASEKFASSFVTSIGWGKSVDQTRYDIFNILFFPYGLHGYLCSDLLLFIDPLAKNFLQLFNCGFSYCRCRATGKDRDTTGY